jgi:hypothetical protein
MFENTKYKIESKTEEYSYFRSRNLRMDDRLAGFSRVILLLLYVFPVNNPSSYIFYSHWNNNVTGTIKTVSKIFLRVNRHLIMTQICDHSHFTEFYFNA